MVHSLCICLRKDSVSYKHYNSSQSDTPVANLLLLQSTFVFPTERQPSAPWTLQSQKNHLQKREVITGQILQGPQNRTVFEGSIVSFNCTGSAIVETIVWNINQILNISTHIDSGLIVSTLFMVAHHQYNGTAVWCSAICGGELCGRSEIVTLTMRSTYIHMQVNSMYLMHTHPIHKN